MVLVYRGGSFAAAAVRGVEQCQAYAFEQVSLFKDRFLNIKTEPFGSVFIFLRGFMLDQY